MTNAASIDGKNEQIAKQLTTAMLDFYNAYRTTPKFFTFYGGTIAYCVSVSDPSDEPGKDIWFYLTVTKDGDVWFTESPKTRIEMTADELIFVETNYDDEYIKVADYRFYGFEDLIRPAIKARLDKMVNECENGGMANRWSGMNMTHSWTPEEINEARTATPGAVQ